MKYNEPLFVVYDIRRDYLAESGDNSLLLIFDNENDALDCADQSQFWEVHEVVIRRIL